MLSLDEKIEERLKELNEKDKQIVQKFFTNSEILDKIFAVVRKNFELIEPMGNYNSDLMIVVNDDISLNNKVIQIVKAFFDTNGVNMYDTYITTYAKTNNDTINQTLIQKEIQVLNPRRIIGLGVDGCSNSLTKEEYNLFKSCLGDAEKINTEEYKAIKAKFISLIKYIITGEE